jgi:hypothetical protein
MLEERFYQRHAQPVQGAKNLLLSAQETTSAGRTDQPNFLCHVLRTDEETFTKNDINE